MAIANRMSPPGQFFYLYISNVNFVYIINHTETIPYRLIKKNIAISEPNYVALKKLGFVGDSFDDVISRILDKMRHNDTKINATEHDARASSLRELGELEHE